MCCLGHSSTRNPEVPLAQVALESCDLLDEDNACGVHVHQVVVGGSKVNPVPRSLLWQGGCVKKCRFLKQNKRRLLDIPSQHQTSPDELSAKELGCVEARKLNSLDQRSSRVEIFHQFVGCQLADFDPASEPAKDKEW